MNVTLHATYDPEADALYIKLPLPQNGHPVNVMTDQLAKDINCDYFEGNMIGIEILHASNLTNIKKLCK